jgi:hypothetical protein
MHLERVKCFFKKEQIKVIWVLWKGAMAIGGGTMTTMTHSMMLSIIFIFISSPKCFFLPKIILISFKPHHIEYNTKFSYKTNITQTQKHK